MTATTITLKHESLYVAYAPDFDVSAWGSCRDEALNNLATEIRQHDTTGPTGGVVPAAQPSPQPAL